MLWWWVTAENELVSLSLLYPLLPVPWVLPQDKGMVKGNAKVLLCLCWAQD